MKKKLATLPGGFRGREKPFLWLKIFIFSPQHIFRFTKMADQKTIYNVVIFISYFCSTILENRKIFWGKNKSRKCRKFFFSVFWSAVTDEADNPAHTCFNKNFTWIQITGGFSTLKKINFWLKLFILSPQNIFRFSKIAG